MVQTADVSKGRHLHVRIGIEEVVRLAVLASHRDMPEAQLVRQLIKRDAAALVASSEGRDPRLAKAAVPCGDRIPRRPRDAGREDDRDRACVA